LPSRLAISDPDFADLGKMPDMTRAWVSVLCVLGFSISGCAGGTPAAQAPDSDPPPATEPAPETAPAALAETPGAAPAAESSDIAGAPAETTSPAPDKDAAETRTSEAVAAVIRGNRKPFRDCYEKATKELPDLKGTLTLHFVLDPDGKVKTAELNQERSTIKAPAVVDCAVSVLKGMKFPASSRGMESVINYPFDFKP
jgi:pyruvate/2-oxoglutarate dehydrogenase complex dihydrolipoamide acyltransferase (E2) component